MRRREEEQTRQAIVSQKWTKEQDDSREQLKVATEERDKHVRQIASLQLSVIEEQRAANSERARAQTQALLAAEAVSTLTVRLEKTEGELQTLQQKM